MFYDKELKPYSRALRNNMTDAELHLWSTLRMKQLKGYQFYRQKIIGNYIVDFYCPQAKLVIEVDGGQHYSGQIETTDKKRDEYLKSHGFKVLRFNNLEVLQNIEGVVDRVLEDLGNPSSN